MSRRRPAPSPDSGGCWWYPRRKWSSRPERSGAPQAPAVAVVLVSRSLPPSVVLPGEVEAAAVAEYLKQRRGRSKSTINYHHQTTVD